MNLKPQTGLTINTMIGKSVNLNKDEMPDLILTEHKGTFCYIGNPDILYSREELDMLFKRSKR